MRIWGYFTFLFLVFAANSKGQSWQRVSLTEHASGYNLYNGIFFGDTGIVIAADGYIFKTNDLFETYVIDSTYLSGGFNGGLSFPSRDIGYISSSDFQGGLLKTADGGGTWNPLTSLPLRLWGQILHFINPDTGYSVLKDGSNIYYTNDGGVSKLQNSIPKYAYQFKVIRDSIIYLLGVNDVAAHGTVFLIKSTDYGINWQTVSYINSITWFADLYILDDTTIIESAEYLILKSKNGGNTFDTVMSNHMSYNLYGDFSNAISFANHDTGFVAYGASVYKTCDAGDSWARTNFMFEQAGDEIKFIYAISGTKAIVGTANGNIYKTTTGGGIWSGINDVAEEKSFTIYPNPTSGKLFGTISSTNTKTTLQIIAPDGRIVLQNVSIQQTRFEADVSTLATGIYFLVLQDEQERFVKKFIKM